MMATSKVLTNEFLLVLLIYTIVGQTERVMRPKFTEMKLWSDNVHVTHSVTLDVSDPHMNFTADVLQDLHDVDLHWDIYISQKQNPTYFFATNGTVNLCRILNWQSQSPIGSLVHAYLKEFGNVLDVCPIAKDKYYLHKIWIPEDTATSVIPELYFQIIFQAYLLDSNKERSLILNDHITGEGVVQDVTNIQRSIFSILPKAG